MNQLHLVPVVLLIRHDQESTIVYQITQEILHTEAAVRHKKKKKLELNTGSRNIYLTVGFTVHFTAPVWSTLSSRKH